MLAFLLSSCVSLADPEASQVHQQDILYTISANEADWVGQSFISGRSGLISITIQTSLVGEGSESPSILQVELFHSIEENKILYSTRLAARNGAVRISFPAQDDPPGQVYLLKLSASNQSIQIKGRSEDIYPDGSAYANGTSIQGDLAFSTTYDYGLTALVMDIKHALPKSYLLLESLIVLLLPGLFLSILLFSRKSFDLGEKVALSAGLSLAILPLIMLWTTLAGLAWSRLAVIAGTCILLIGSGILAWQKKAWLDWRIDHYDLALVVIFVTSLVIRLIMVRDMAGTAWIDSVHHGLVTRLILERGTLPTSFLPYFDINPTDYHPGFHTSVAVFTWLSNLDMDRAMLFFGQVMNALAVFAVYLFTKTLTHSKLAGVVAALAAGLCTPMPAYYTTWGRYTQLAGTVILPVPLALFQKSFLVQNDKWRTLLAACISAAGLFLVHYRVMAFLAILMVFYFIFYFLLDRSKKDMLAHASLLALGCVLLASLLAAPWLVPMVTKTVAPLSGGTATSIDWFSDFSWRYLNTALGQPVMALAAFGLVASLLLRERLGYLISFWVAALFLLANPTKIGFPGAFLNNTSVAIFLFLPMAALSGYAIELAASSWRMYAPALYKPFMLSLAIGGIMVGYMGAQRILPILNPGTILLRQADIPALKWAATNLPTNTTVAINPFLWGYGIYAGSDGGFWLTPISGVRTMPPPVLSSMGGIEENSKISQKIIELGKDSNGLADFLRSVGIEYLYLGARGGAISPAALLADPQYQVLYHAGGVWIFQLSSK
jgi:hypothetical protein